MSLNPDFKDLLSILNGCEVKYLIVGAYAVMYFTEPRYTKDIDIWIEPTPENAERAWQALAKFGSPLKKVSLADFCNKELIYQIGVAPNRIDIMMDIPGVSFKTAWKNRVASTYDAVPINILNRNELIRAKKKAGREQDRLDLERLKYKTAAGNKIKK